MWAVIGHVYLYLLALIVGFLVGATYGVNQMRRYYLRRSMAKLTVISNAHAAGNPAGIVELPGAEALHRFIFGSAK